MHNPRPSVVGFKTYNNRICGVVTGIDYISANRVFVVINSASGTLDDREGMAMKMDRMLR